MRRAMREQIELKNNDLPHTWPITPREVREKRALEQDVRRLVAEWRELNPTASPEQVAAARAAIRAELS